MINSNLPVILLKNLVLFPYQEVRVEIKSDVSKRVTEIAKLYHNGEVLIVCPLNTLEEKPDTSDLPKIGVVGKIKNIIDLPNGNMRVIISGLYRVEVINYSNYPDEKEILNSTISIIDLEESEIESAAYKRKLTNELENYVDKNPFVTNAIVSQLKTNITLDKLTDIISTFLPLSFEKKLNLMLESSAVNRSKILIKELAIESAVIDLESHIETEIKKGLDETQKEFILKEKLKVIKDELGETNNREDDINSLRNKIETKKFPSRIKSKLVSELERYNSSSEMSPDSGIIRNYIDYLLSIPWCIETKDEKDLLKIEKKLDLSHYGMDNAKTRIVEFIAVKSINPDIQSPIICLVGPPGVGKTTFAESIAYALNRKFVKISLGGMSDSAELVGHRRAYIGSNPGKIVTSLIKCGSNNPVFLLDEVDKLKKDYKGDPASTLLDILDVSQNKRFVDNYLDEEIDLSKVLFILTANDISTIPAALLDRMEIINLSGYSLKEKLLICENYIIPNVLKKLDFKNNVIKFEKSALEKIIKDYTCEAGVRELDRCINKIIRKVITECIKSSKKIMNIKIKSKDLSHYLEKGSYFNKKEHEIKVPGVVKTVGCNNMGGTIMDVECSAFKGNGKFTFTGSLGEVTRESIEVAISYIKSNCKQFNIDEDFFQKNDLHIHFTENASFKDGPSAGIAITTAILSLLKNKVISEKITYTGEITLKGDILKVGGIKEKSIACSRNNINKFYIPLDNEDDVKWLDKELTDSIEFIPISNYIELYNKLFK